MPDGRSSAKPGDSTERVALCAATVMSVAFPRGCMSGLLRTRSAERYTFK